MKVLRIASRGSDLALWQAEHVAGRLRATSPGLEVGITIISTTGDRILDAPLSKIGGKGLFTKEIEDALLDGRCDLAVHSLKDLPTDLPAGLALGAVLSRSDPSDVLISAHGIRLAELPAGCRIGTSSLRRQAQLLHARPELSIQDLRGNVPTRLRKATSGEFDAVVLARAGLERLGMLDSVTEVLPFELMLPAPGQGALGIEIRQADEATARLVGRLEEPLARDDHGCGTRFPACARRRMPGARRGARASRGRRSRPARAGRDGRRPRWAPTAPRRAAWPGRRPRQSARRSQKR